jgi:hypothetical protein
LLGHLARLRLVDGDCRLFIVRGKFVGFLSEKLTATCPSRKLLNLNRQNTRKGSDVQLGGAGGCPAA